MASEEKPPGAGINRRAFMRKAGATAASVAVVAAGADVFILNGPASAAQEELPLTALDPEGLLKPGPLPPENVLEGQILSMGERSLAVKPVESPPVEVRLTSNSHISREGRVSLNAYRPGDEVVLLGGHRGDTFTAVGMAAVFRIVDATLYSRDGSTLHTSEGKVLITSSTAPKGWVSGDRRVDARPLADLKPGDVLVIMGLINQRSSDITASLIGVLVSDRSSSLSS